MLNRVANLFTKEEKSTASLLSQLRGMALAFPNVSILMPHNEGFAVVNSDYEPGVSKAVLQQLISEFNKIVGEKDWCGRINVYTTSPHNHYTNVCIREPKKNYLLSLLQQLRTEEILKLWSKYPEELASATIKRDYHDQPTLHITCAENKQKELAHEFKIFIGRSDFYYSRTLYLSGIAMPETPCVVLFNLITSTGEVYRELNQAIALPKDLGKIVISYLI